MISNKKELKKKGSNIFLNEDLTQLRAKLLKICKGATRRGEPDKAGRQDTGVAQTQQQTMEANTPADLHRVGVAAPD